MPEIVNNGDSEALVKMKIIDILEFDGISTENILSWGVATVRLNMAATRLGFPHLDDRESGTSARAKINALALSPAPIFPSNTELPEISGIPRYLENLEGSSGVWTSYPTATYSYQWKADGVDISLATNQEFSLTVDEIGKEIVLEVTATNFSGSGLAESLPLGPVISEPINTNPPVINGESSYEEELNVTNGTWAAYPLPISYSYRWFSDNVEISDETDNQYETTIDDIGKSITAEVTASNSEGNNAETTAAFGPITSIPINRVVPVITGYARSGQTLNSNNGTWAAYPIEIDYSYQWFADDELIIDEDNNSLVLTDAVAGKEINIEVDAENELGSNQASSIKTTRVEPSWSPEKASLFIDFGQNRIFDKQSGLGNIDLLSFSRNTNKWSFNDSGILTQYAPNVPARNSQGVLLEPQRTNAVKNNTANTAAGQIVLVDVTRAALGDGDSPAQDNYGKLITQGPSSTANHNFVSNPDAWITADSRHACSIWLKYTGSARYFRFLLSDNVSFVHECRIDIVDKVISYLSSGTTARIIELGNGWVEVQMLTGDFPSTTALAQLSIYSTAGLGSTTRQAGEYGMWGGQVELGATFATSPILTGGATVTRAGDLLTATVPDGGRAFAFDFDMLEPAASIFNGRRLLEWSDGSAGNYWSLGLAVGGTIQLNLSVGSYINSASGSVISGGRNVIFGVAAHGWRRQGLIGGIESPIVTTEQSPPSVNVLGFGSRPTTTNNNAAINARRFAEAPVSDFSSPADAYAWAKSIAEGWAA
jgi:hypothetical protein